MYSPICTSNESLCIARSYHDIQGRRKHSKSTGAHAFRGTLTTKKGALYIHNCEKVGARASSAPPVPTSIVIY